MTWFFHKVVVLQLIKTSLPQFDETISGHVSSFWTHQQGLSHHHEKPKPHICNNMKNVESFYYKFFRTHHAYGACYHFGMGIPSVLKMQYITQRLYNLFKTLTSMKIVCKEICNRMIHFSYYCKYGVLVFHDDETGPADEFKRMKRVQGCSCEIMGGRLLLFAILLLCERTTSFV